MATEKKSSDAVRITRIVTPAILIIALALIFKSELSNTMASGCYEIELTKLGAVSDKSMCSKEEIKQAINSVSTIAIEQSRESAEVALQEMEDMLDAMETEVQRSKQDAMHLAEENNTYREQAFELAQEWKYQMGNLRNTEARNQMSSVYNHFVDVLDIPAERAEITKEIVEPMPEVTVKAATSDIRQRYVKSTEANVTRIRNDIKVKRK